MTWQRSLVGGCAAFSGTRTAWSGDRADSGSSAMNWPCSDRRSSKKWRMPSPCEARDSRPAEILTGPDSGRPKGRFRHGRTSRCGPVATMPIAEPPGILDRREGSIDGSHALRAARFAQSRHRRDGSEQTRLARSILADDDRDRLFEGRVSTHRSPRSAGRTGGRRPAGRRPRPTAIRRVRGTTAVVSWCGTAGPAVALAPQPLDCLREHDVQLAHVGRKQRDAHRRSVAQRQDVAQHRFEIMDVAVDLIAEAVVLIV